MITKSLIILSIVFNTIGLSGLSNNLDEAVIRDQYGESNSVSAAPESLILPSILDRPMVEPMAPDENVWAKEYILVDADTGTVITDKGRHDRVPIASTTKIMSALIVLENYKLDDVVTISDHAANEIGATANFRVGEKITVLNLLKSMLIKSANGAAYALAENANKTGESGTTKFVAMMNKKAKDLGMKNTEYRDPAGLDVTGYSSAYDLSIVTRQALKNSIFAAIVKTPKESVRDITGDIWHALDNSNRLVNEWDYPGAIGVKTGYMPEAGHCLVAAAKRDGHTFIVVVLNTNESTPTASAEESKKLLNWAFENVYFE